MNYELQEQLCIDIYNYLEKKTSGETGVMFTMLKLEMEKQTIEKKKKEAMDKLRAEIETEEITTT